MRSHFVSDSDLAHKKAGAINQNSSIHLTVAPNASPVG